MSRALLRIDAPHFVAALIIRDGRVVNAAPILSWCVGKTEEEVVRYWSNRRGCSVARMPDPVERQGTTAEGQTASGKA